MSRFSSGPVSVLLKKDNYKDLNHMDADLFIGKVTTVTRLSQLRDCFMSYIGFDLAAKELMLHERHKWSSDLMIRLVTPTFHVYFYEGGWPGYAKSGPVDFCMHYIRVVPSVLHARQIFTAFGQDAKNLPAVMLNALAKLEIGEITCI